MGETRWFACVKDDRVPCVDCPYDTAKEAWEVLTPMPLPRYGTSAVAVDGKIFVPGGGGGVQGAGPMDVLDVFGPGL